MLLPLPLHNADEPAVAAGAIISGLVELEGIDPFQMGSHGHP